MYRLGLQSSAKRTLGSNPVSDHHQQPPADDGDGSSSIDDETEQLFHEQPLNAQRQ